MERITSQADALPAAPTRWAWIIVLVLLGVATTAVCLAGAGRSVWTDEAWVIEFARRPTLGESLGAAVKDHQPVAPGYLGVIHLMHRLGLGTISGYRASTAPFAVVMVCLAGWLLGRCAGSRALGLMAAMVLLLCPVLGRYATEIKPYMAEAAVTLALIALADDWLRTGRRQAAVAWGITALAAVVFTFAGWLAVAGSAGIIVLWLAGQRRWRQLAWLGLVAAPTILAAAIIYFTYVRHIAFGQGLHEYWNTDFPPRNPLALIWFWNRGADLLHSAWYLYDIPGGVMMILAAGGALVWLWRQPRAASLAGGVTLTTLTASFAGLWPMGLRINLPLLVLSHVCILAGFVCLLVWIGEGLVRRFPRLFAGSRKEKAAGLTAIGLGLGLAALTVTASSLKGYEVASVGKLLDQVARVAGAGEAVYFDQSASVNQSFRASPRFVVHPTPWPASKAIAQLSSHSNGRILIAFGHYNEFVHDQWSDVVKSVASHGDLRAIWVDRLVVLYEYVPWPGADR